VWIRDQLHAVLSGKLDHADADPSIQSMCRLYFYEGAVEILAVPTKDGRIRALQRIPELVRPHVEKEVWRIYKLRKANK